MFSQPTLCHKKKIIIKPALQNFGMFTHHLHGKDAKDNNLPRVCELQRDLSRHNGLNQHRGSKNVMLSFHCFLIPQKPKDNG